jgi:hypothetical protein
VVAWLISSHFRLADVGCRYARTMPTWEQILAETVEKPPEDLGTLASVFLTTLYADRQWNMVQQALRQLSRFNSTEDILRRQELALRGIAFPAEYRNEEAERRAEDDREAARRALAAELEAAATDLRASAAQLSEQLSKAAQAAEKITEDSPVARAAAPVKRLIESTNLAQKLGPYWMVVLVFWLIYAPSRQIEAASLLYLVLNDYLKKQG